MRRDEPLAQQRALRRLRGRGGGRPERRFFEDDSGCENELDTFLAALHLQHPHEVLLEEYFQRVVRDRGAFPDTFVPFARNAGDDLYVMDRNIRKVFFWAHDVPDEPLRAVSDSLDALLARAQLETDFYG